MATSLPGWRLDVAVPAPTVAAFEEALCARADAVASDADPKNGLIAVQAYFAAPPARASLAGLFAAVALAVGCQLPAFTLSALDDVDWVAESQRRLPPLRAGRFHLFGAHVTEPPPAASIPLLIEASVAFGTGRHESTRGCLLALQAIARTGFQPKRALDLGCGSGVLAMAMAKLWPGPVLAVDNDPQAVAVARDNAKLNGLARRVRAAYAQGCHGRTVATFGRFDLVAANILARPLAAMAREITANLAPGAFVVLSGLQSAQERQLLGKYRALGLCLWRRFLLDDWSTLVVRRRGAWARRCRWPAYGPSDRRAEGSRHPA